MQDWRKQAGAVFQAATACFLWKRPACITDDCRGIIYRRRGGALFPGKNSVNKRSLSFFDILTAPETVFKGSSYSPY